MDPEHISDLNFVFYHIRELMAVYNGSSAHTFWNEHKVRKLGRRGFTYTKNTRDASGASRHTLLTGFTFDLIDEVLTWT